MKRKRKNHRKERMIMLGSSVMVLTALTVTGLYVKEKKEIKNEEYVVDLSELEESDITEYAYDDTEEEESKEVNSLDIKEKEWTFPEKTWEVEEEDVEVETEEVFFDMFASKEEELSFSEEDRLLWPVVGNVLVNYDMENPVYFATLDQYKLNPAIVIQAKEGQNIHSAARGKVTKIEKTPELGNVITMDIGNGYEVVYGQLTNMQVKEGDMVEKEAYLADVAAPTKYYATEGDNVYFALRKDGEPLNPMTKLQ